MYIPGPGLGRRGLPRGAPGLARGRDRRHYSIVYDTTILYHTIPYHTIV